MDEIEFIKQQFLTLRKEIEIAKDKRFQIQIGGVVGVPAFYLVGEKLDIKLMNMLLPLIVVIIVLLYLSENNGIMRAGRYIRTQIEPRYKDIKGWETWLEATGREDRRSVDKYVNASFILLSALYYLLTVIMGLTFLQAEYGNQFYLPVLIAYLALGGFVLALILKRTKVDTSK